MNAVDSRLQALKILTALLRDQTALTYGFSSAQEVTALTRELCFGVCRNYYRLQAIANHLVAKKPKELEVWLALLLGLYQLHYLNKPEYAVVKETVALLDKVKKSWAKGLVNAVLRQFCRHKDAIVQAVSQQDLYQWNHPEWLVKKIKADWPQQWQDILAANDRHPPMVLRVNASKISQDAYLEMLLSSGIGATRHSLVPSAIVLDAACDVNDLPGFQDGWVSVQDAAAQLAAPLLDLKPQQRVLDACCAPGGKTGHILETEPDLTACVALDVDERRMQRVEQNMTRLGVRPVLAVGDMLKPEEWWDGQYFDRILLDAPCSALGVIRRHPDIKLLRSLEEIKIVATLQSAILDKAWSYLAPNGLMVYATCSICPEENETQIAAFIARHADVALVTIDVDWGIPTPHGRQIVPGLHGMDGFFYSIMRKK